MNYADYVDIYDSEHHDFDEDVRFFVQEARERGGPVLELGCGTGRVLFEVLKTGVECWGLDNCSQMLDRARRRASELSPEAQERLHLVSSSMRDFNLPRDFRMIYLPFREFMHLMSVSEQLDTLYRIADHLHPQGVLFLNHYDADVEALRQGPDHCPVLYRQKHSDFIDPQSQRQVLVSATTTFDPVPQALYEERIYETLDEQGRVAEKKYLFLSQRWFFRWEMYHLLERAGLRVKALYSSYARTAYRKFGSDLIWEARLANREELDQELQRLTQLRAKVTSGQEGVAKTRNRGRHG